MTEDQIQQCKQKLLLIQKKHQELEASYAEEAREKEENGSTELHNQAAHGRLSLMQAMERQKTGFSRLHTNPTHTRCKKCVNEQ